MRYGGVWVVVAACSGSPGGVNDARPADAKPIDAMPDADCANVPVPDCVFGGLAGLPFDGTTPWTWAGTMSDGQQTSPFSATVYFLRQGCTLQQANAPITSPGPGMRITDTAADYHDSVETPHPHTDSGAICMSSADNAIHYTQDDIQMMQTTVDFKTTGILTHP